MVEELKKYTRCGLIRELSYKRRESIISEGSSEEGIYVLEDGAVELYTFVKSKRNVLDLLLPGDVFGVISNSTYKTSYGARAITASKVLHISMDGLKKLGETDPGLILELFSSLLDRQAYLYRVFTLLSATRATDRIRNLLQLLDKNLEERNIKLTVNKFQISSIAGLSYEHTVRCMSGLKTLESRRLRIW